MGTPTGKEDSSYIFQHLVRGKSDMPGFIAYAFYKFEKIEHIRRFRDEKGREPTQAELLEFRNLCCNKERLDGYRKTGKNQFENFNQVLYKKIGRQIEQEFNDTMDQRIRDAVNAAFSDHIPKRSWWDRHSSGFFESMAASLILGLLALLAYLCKVGPSRFVEFFT